MGRYLKGVRNIEETTLNIDARRLVVVAIVLLAVFSSYGCNSSSTNPYKGKILGVWPVKVYMGKDNPGLSYVLAVDPATKKVDYLYTYMVGNNLQVALSPDGQLLAMNLWDDRDTCNINVMDIKKGTVEKISDLNGEEMRMRWVDDRRIIFIFGSHEGVLGSKLLIVDKDTKEVEDLGKKLNLDADPQNDLFLAVDVDRTNKLVAFSYGKNQDFFDKKPDALYACNEDGSNLRKLWNCDKGSIYDIRFSEDGTKIVLAARWYDESGCYRGKIIVVNIEDSSSKVIVDSSSDYYYNTSPVFLSENEILFTSSKINAKSQRDYRMYKCKVDTGKISSFELLLKPEGNDKVLPINLGSMETIY